MMEAQQGARVVARLAGRFGATALEAELVQVELVEEGSIRRTSASGLTSPSTRGGGSSGRSRSAPVM